MYKTAERRKYKLNGKIKKVDTGNDLFLKYLAAFLQDIFLF